MRLKLSPSIRVLRLSSFGGFLFVSLCFVCQAPSVGGRSNASKIDRSCEVVYLALGDSTGVGIGSRAEVGYVDLVFTRIRRLRQSAHLANECRQGAATRDVLHDQMKNLSALRPTLVTIGIGTNDLIQGISEEEFASNYQLIIARLKQQDAQIVLMNIADLSLAPAVPLSLQGAARQRILTFNKRIELIALSQKLPLVDLYSMTPDFSKHPEYFAKDGIHPSDAGYEFWARALWPKVHSALNKQRCH